MSSKMSNIIHFCEFEWFEWVMFWDKAAPYPNVDIGPALLAKIIKKNS